jgi:hypothetical protein
MGIFLKKMPMPSFGRHYNHPENALARLSWAVRQGNSVPREGGFL